MCRYRPRSQERNRADQEFRSPAKWRDKSSRCLSRRLVGKREGELSEEPQVSLPIASLESIHTPVAIRAPVCRGQNASGLYSIRYVRVDCEAWDRWLTARLRRRDSPGC